MKSTKKYIVGKNVDLPVITGFFSGSMRIYFHWTGIQLYTEVPGQSGYKRKFIQILFYSLVYQKYCK